MIAEGLFFLVIIVAMVGNLFRKESLLYKEKYEQTRTENMEMFDKLIKAFEVNQALEMENDNLKKQLNK